MVLVKELQYFAKDMSILIVDSDVELSDYLKTEFEKFFKNVYCAHDGIEGFEKYRECRPDIIFTDIKLPKLDGIKLAREIKNIRRRDQGIIVGSTHSDAHDMIELIDIGIDQFILKPYDKNTLIYKLLKVSENIVYKKEFDKFYKQKILERIKSEHDKDAKIGDIKEESIEDLSMFSGLDEGESYYAREIETADDFINELQSDEYHSLTFENDMASLMQYNDDFKEQIEMLSLNGLTFEIRNDIVRTLDGYVEIFSTFDKMSRMTETIQLLMNFLIELDIDSLNK